MSEVKIAAELRTEFGKGASRRIRRAHKVPAVLYGHGTEPLHLSLPGHETMLAMKTANVLITLDIEGGLTELALPKHVQRDVLKGYIEHVDLLLVRRGEKVVVDIPVQLEGEAAPGTLVNLDLTTIALEAEATHLPQRVIVSVEGLEAGTRIHAGNLKLPEGASLNSDPELLVVNVTQAPTAEQMEGEETGEAAETEAPADAAETTEQAAAE